MEEVEIPSVKEVLVLSDSSFTGANLIQMENEILHALKYRVATVTPHHFLGRIALAGELLDYEIHLVKVY